MGLEPWVVELNPLVGVPLLIEGDKDGQAVFNGIIASMEGNKESRRGIKVSDPVVETSYDDRAGKTWANSG